MTAACTRGTRGAREATGPRGEDGRGAHRVRPMTERLLTFEEAARELRCSLATVKRRVRAGELPVFRDGRIVRVRSTDLERFILERVRRTIVLSEDATFTGSPLPAGGRLWD